MQFVCDICGLNPVDDPLKFFLFLTHSPVSNEEVDISQYYSELTSMSSLNCSKGASMMFRSWKDSDSTSKLWLVISSSLFQWRSSIALLAIISSRGQVSLKSSILFFKSLKASHSLRALGSLRHLWRYE